jgi:hypothetical protein
VVDQFAGDLNVTTPKFRCCREDEYLAGHQAGAARIIYDPSILCNPFVEPTVATINSKIRPERESLISQPRSERSPFRDERL